MSESNTNDKKADELDLSFMRGVPSKVPDLSALIIEVGEGGDKPRTPVRATKTKPKQNPNVITVLSYVFQVYHVSGVIPTVENISNATGQGTKFIEHCFDDPEFLSSLARSGIDYRPDNKASILLDPVQIAAVDMVLNIHDKRTIRQKLEEVGVSTQKFQAWQRNPTFKAYFHERARLLFGDIEPVARVRLVEAVDDGDLKAIQLLFEMTGTYTPKVRHELDINVVLVQIMEIIQKRVQDPLVIDLIADDIGRLGEGNPL